MLAVTDRCRVWSQIKLSARIGSPVRTILNSSSSEVLAYKAGWAPCPFLLGSNAHGLYTQFFCDRHINASIVNSINVQIEITMSVKLYVVGVMASKMVKCPDCSEVVGQWNLSRHRRRKHALPPVPLLCRGVSLADAAGQSAGDHSG